MGISQALVLEYSSLCMNIYNFGTNICSKCCYIYKFYDTRRPLLYICDALFCFTSRANDRD